MGSVCLMSVHGQPHTGCRLRPGGAASPSLSVLTCDMQMGTRVSLRLGDGSEGDLKVTCEVREDEES